jgi:GAF domain-containing protein
MDTDPSAQHDPHMPLVMGFEMPSSALAGNRTPQVMVVLLNIAPSREWLTAFIEQLDVFKGEYHIADIRVTGPNISVIGPVGVLRTLTGELKAFVHRVSRLCLQQRVTARSEKAPTKPALAAPAPAPEPSDQAQVEHDLQSIARIGGIPAILEAVTRATGMRFAAVARVSDSRWTACAVYDQIQFGLKPGQDLVLESTICNEIRQHGRIVAFDHASTHPVFHGHPTPAMYGFESYISIPILRPDGAFFGTLCALDPEPSRLDQATIETLQMFARAIGAELEAVADAN